MRTTTDVRDAAVAELFDRLRRAWTDGDAAAYGDCFTADADYVAYDGTITRGRAAIVRSHDDLFRGVLSGSALVGELESVRWIDAEVAVAHGTGSVLVAWRTRPPRGRRSRQTLVVVGTDQGLRIAALHNSRVRPVRVPDPASPPARAARALGRAATALRLGRPAA